MDKDKLLYEIFQHAESEEIDDSPLSEGEDVSDDEESGSLR
eukprot:CAMPEP_0118940300 /NCGR_PEP_ID=MMETSP1169-20130426/31074_1 /TAXON_ID=36882 /ORGANISM="Pyramimonas obovata, Strain CCMP722" /LENGTH=40 /DNA_ID= /DNA_START= /DNA_END= /DNA_ORIENTATION=